MSRRLNPAAEKATANQNVIKSLLKLTGNRVCADCKRNKLPRWASWNLGIFICIRCSGIHRGMGTHISKVKSVDLDSWTDEQLQNVVKWGNSRANKYWEANLAPGHVPSEAKIENFIRTKYEAKRWVMESEIPDPSTLDEEDDDNVPLKVVQEKLGRKTSTAPAATAAISPPSVLPQRQSNFNIFDDDPPITKTVPPVAKTSSKTTKVPDSASLLGLDFFAAAPTPSPRPSPVNSDPGKMTSSSRPDLNRSILSLYASAPRPQQQQPRQQTPTMPGFSSPTQSSAFGDLNSSFSGLSFSTRETAQEAPPKPSPFANLTAGMKKTPAAPRLSKPSPSRFFAPAEPVPVAIDFGALAVAPASPPTVLNAQPTVLDSPTSSNMGSLSFDTNAWVTPAPTTSTASSSNNAWGTATLSSSNAWGSMVPVSKPAVQSSSVTNDDEWGNFSSGAPAKAVSPVKASNGGFDDDLFGNVWK